MVSDLQFHNNDETWSMNLKRSIINMLQLNLHKMGRTDETEMERYENVHELKNDYFTVNERTIEGDCEVAYTIVRKEEDVTEVTKSVNFNKCSRRPHTMYNFRYLTECRDCKEKNILEPSTVYTYLLGREGIKNVEVRSIYTFTIENQPVVKTEIRARITLENKHEIQREFYMKGDEVEVLPYKNVHKKIEEIQKIIESIKGTKENTKETTLLLARVVSLLRMCTMKELHMVNERIYKNGDVRVRKLIEHCLSIAGTKNTITHLLRLMQMGNIHTHRILLLFKRSPVVRQALWLTIGSMMRGVVGYTKDENVMKDEEVFAKKERSDLKLHYLNLFRSHYDEAKTIYEKVLCLKWLANAGIDLSAFELERIIKNKREELPVRMEAIDALRLLREVMPRKIQSILMPIYKDRHEEPELRMAALVRIMHTLPHQPVIVQIISTMEREPNHHVATFTYDLLKSFVHSTHTCYKKLAKEIRPLLSMTRYVRGDRMLTSTYKYIPMFTEDMLSGLNMDFATIFGKNSVWPKEVMMSLDTVFNGMWNKYLFQLGFSQQNIEKLLEKITRKLVRMETEVDNVVRGRRIRESMNILKEIAKKLNIRPRVIDNRTPHVMLYLRYKDMDYAVLPINEEVVDELVEKYIREGRLETRELDRLFHRDPEFNLHTFTFFFENIKKIPTTLGLPLITKFKMPTVFSAEGTFVIKRITDGLRVEMVTEPSLAATKLIEMRLWNPLFEQGIKVVHAVEGRIPLDFVMEMTYNREFHLMYTMNVPTEEKTLIRVMSHPVVFFRFLSDKREYFHESEQKTVLLPRWKRHNEKEKIFEFAGIKTVLRGNWLNKWNMRDVLLGEYDWEFVMIPTQHAPRKVKFIFDSGKIEKIRMEKPDFTNLFEKEFETEETEYERFEERERLDRFERRLADVERAEGYRHRMNLRIDLDTPVSRYGNVEFVTVCDEKLRYCKLIIDGKRSPMLRDETHEWNFKTNIQFVLPHMPKSLKELKEQIHREIQGLFVTVCDEKLRYCKLIIDGKRSPMLRDETHEWNFKTNIQAARLNQLKTVVEYKLTPFYEQLFERVYNFVRGYTFWNCKVTRVNNERNRVFLKLNVDPVSRNLISFVLKTPYELLKTVVEYKLTPFYEQLFERVYNFVRGYTFWNCKVTRVNNERNRVFLKLNVDPVSRNLISFVLKTPYELVELRDFVVPQLYLPSIAKRTLRDIRDEMVKERMCEVKSTKVKTFDDVIFHAPLTNCYSVIAKDCSEEPRFAVLVKKMRKDTDEKAIINEHEDVIRIEMRDEKLMVTVNDKRINKEELERYNIEMMEENMVRVKLEDIEVRFDGYTVKVYMGKHMIEKQCGLCGHFDEEKDNEFLTPRMEHTHDLMEFHKSYLLNEECEMENELLTEKKHYKMEERSERDADELDYFFNDERTRKDKWEEEGTIKCIRRKYDKERNTWDLQTFSRGTM
ncbi:unnamed protein product [Strongylus vulgaris]|uniref:VWFD domain-containing protein n=1 Tax=Strongylus vulgaris TaxID=40348 RepID=A0A3P7JLI1_STRVU|nr:unnamed protein product [Strongylus vulgaris]